MKKLILCLSFLYFVSGLAAQDNSQLARQATEETADMYQLDEAQARQVLTIQERRLRNLAAIESLQGSNDKLYWQKKNAIREGTLASIKYLLNEAQMEIFNQQLVERRKRESALIQQLKQEGATREDIQIAIWKLE